jgi:hypothetical protein
MPRSAEYCIELPDDFPEAELAKFMAAARSVLLRPDKSPMWTEFAGASNLIAWRYRASTEDWQLFKTSLASPSGSGHEENFRRERALFGMFTAGVSCIESASYALAALASHPAVLAIPFGAREQRRCRPSVLRDWIAPHTRASTLTNALDSLLVSSEWRLWVELRDRMTHRSNLPRIYTASVGAPPPPAKPMRFAATSSTRSVDAEVADFDALRAWLSTTLASLLSAGATLP